MELQNNKWLERSQADDFDSVVESSTRQQRLLLAEKETGKTADAGLLVVA